MPAAHLERANNGYFYVHWTEGRRSRRESTRAKELRAAEAYFSEWLKLRNAAPTTPESALLLSDLWAAYLGKHVRPNVASVQTAEYAWKNLSAAFADKGPQDVTQAAVERYVRRREAGEIGQPSVAATIRRELVVLRACLNWCASPKRKLIRPEQIQPFDLPPDGTPRERWLRADEIDRLLRAAEGHDRVELFLWLALETAARRSAILGLTWDRVDLELDVIDYRDPGARVTKKRRSVVPISRKLKPILLRAHENRSTPFVLGHAGDVDKSVYRIADKAGLEGVSPHVLRHTAATNLARNGVPLWKIAKLLGNSVVIVERVYAKHCPDDLRAAVDMISN